MSDPYDALLVVSFGGPEGSDDVIPFLENVLRGRNVPRERLLEVAHHYERLGGKSPINDQNRALIASLARELEEHGPKLPIYWGNRNWHPLLADTLRQMASDGVRRALAFVTSAFSSYSGCRQYRENIAAAQVDVGPAAPQIDKLRVFYNHPGFIEPMIERTCDALASITPERRGEATIVFTAHSIPVAMAEKSRYEMQLREACRLVADGVEREGVLRARNPSFNFTETNVDSSAIGAPESWRLVYQSRSGPPTQPWLEPDIGEYLRSRHEAQSLGDVVVVPIGFISDHMEVLYDLDIETRQLCHQLGINMVRAATVGAHPRFIAMIRELIVERVSDQPVRRSLGTLGPSHDICPDDCCLYAPARR